MISHTKLRSAMDGCKLPSRKRPFPLSQTDSIFARDSDNIFSPSAAAFGFKGRPSAGPRVELRTYVAGTNSMFKKTKAHQINVLKELKYKFIIITPFSFFLHYHRAPKAFISSKRQMHKIMCAQN